MLQAPGDASRFFVVEHTGTIRSFPADPAVSRADVFLDLRARTKVIYESGMNGLVFHPDWAHNGQAFVTYDAPVADNPNQIIEQWRLSRFVSRDGGKTLDPSSEQILIALDKKADEHNAGKMAFGSDGLLYVSVGDGGPSFDPNKFGQRLDTLYGKILRIDVDHPANGLPYGIPSTNPFAAGGGRGEIWAYGLRNPWRWSFDRKTGELWAGDVGQDAYDEIDLITKGGNYGWGNMEATHCTRMVPTNCRLAGMIDPVLELPHPGVQAVIGGFVYRGTAIPDLVGTYVFGDFVSGRISLLLRDATTGKASSQVVDATGKRITTFAEDADGELYFLEYSNTGGIYKLTGGPCQSTPGDGGANYHFLMRAGITSEADANAYYTAIGAAATPTLDAWKSANFGTLPTVSSYYQNLMDLGFWREMTCTQTVARGAGGCMVRNWRNEGDRDANNPLAPNLGTVTMNVSAAGVTRFYVFAPDGKLQPFAILDGEGKKFVPGVCNACHTGHYQAAGSVDLGSVFREFEPSLLMARTGVSDTQAQAEWFALNQAVRSANSAVHGEAEGAPLGTDHAKQAMLKYLDDMYPTGAPPARAVNDAAHLPATWAAPAPNPVLGLATRTLYTTTVSRYCMGCHRINALDFTNYGTFSSLASYAGNTAVLELYIDADLTNPTALPMPQSQLMFENLHKDGAALQAVQDWLTEMWNPAVPQTRVSFEIDNADFTQWGDDIYVVGDVPELGGWNPYKGVRLDGSAFPTWRGSVIMSQSESVQWKAVVITRTGAVGWETGANRTFTVPTSTTFSVVGTWRR
jgi:glucose/arabinose dehydrogenase